jgi:integrase
VEKTMKITKQVVDDLKPGTFVWDRGFGVKATETGSKVYVVSYRIGRRKRRYTIGRHGAPWTPDTARREALRLLTLAGSGVDPMEMKAAGRKAPTMRELAERFLAEHVEVKCKPRTAELYRGIVEKVVLPALGTRAVTDVTRADLAALHHRLRRTPSQANRTLLMVSKMMNLAERWGLRPDGSNPARHVERFREQARQRYLSPDEFKRLGAALTQAHHGPVRLGDRDVRLSPTALNAIGLLIFTGARRSEVLTLKWEHVDLERGVLTLPKSKTGFKTIMLNTPAIVVLKALPRVEDNPYVLPGLREGQHLVNISDTWYAVRDVAGLKDVRLHDLRHSLASVGAGAGLSLPIIGGLLGHTQAQTTKRYAHLAADPLKAAAELVGARIAAAMGMGR